MAKVEMKYMEVAAPMSDAKKILDLLQLRGVLELKELESVEGLSSLSSESTASYMEKYRSSAQTALSILDKYVPVKSSLTSALKGLPEMSASEYEKKSSEADEILGVCYDIISAEKTITENKAEIARCHAAMDAVEPWLTLDVPMQYKGTKETDAYIGYVQGEYTADSLEIALAQYLEGEELYSAEVISVVKDRTCIFVLSSKECSEKVFSALRQIGFAYPSDPTKHVPSVRYERMQKKAEQCEEKSKECEELIKELASSREDIKFDIDWFTVKRDKYEALSKVSAGDNFIAFGGYIPAEETDRLVKELEENFIAAVTVSGTEEDDDVPVLLKNKPFAAAVEPITEMYSLPGKDDIDPNPIMSIFYYLLFGIMLSDAGYGLIMAIACGIAKFKFKVQGKLKKTVDMYFWCGLTTVFWGALFGSWFGDIVPRVAEQFFGVADLGVRINNALGFDLFNGVYAVVDGAKVIKYPGSIAIWFESVNDPTKLLLFSFLFGIIHLFAGVIAGMVKMIKAKNVVGAICDGIPVMLIVIGIAPLGAKIIGGKSIVSESIESIAMYVALAGAILVVLTAGRDSKNIVGKLGLGLYGLYNTASGWMGDILSYSRLLALGLCTGVIATVVNTLGTIPDSKGAKLGLLIPVFIFGHIVNMAINLIGTYVHTNRLQYVEFFAKFYEGGGRAFTPLKTNTKYFNVKEDN